LKKELKRKKMKKEIKHTLHPENWVDLYADYLYNYTIARVSKHEVSKDLVQETFFAGLKSKKGFEGKASERTWLVSILKRKIIDYYRKINSNKGKAEVRMNFYSDGENEGNWLEERVPQTWGIDADKKMENEELENTLNACIEKLPEKYAMVFKMKTLRDFSTEQICNELDISSSNLWVIIHRARTQLRRCMEDNWFVK
jgi:RNA polymerase sigma-70 factor (TIGR02943 family)